MARYLLIDGHSVIFAWPELRALHQRQSRPARENLIRQLQRLHDMGGWEVTVVFDGKGADSTSQPVRARGDLVVAYSRKDQTADSVIEALVAAQPTVVRENITVVTADGGERVTIEALGAICLSPEWLRAEMGAVLADFEETLAQTRRKGAW